ncbi:nucleotidyltransferase family protein [Mesobacillus sp. AQ2]|uniref:nucleotidyltransferase family protein n=1 Tax=Mesobacillus sp. AQ2 TaxID=3043332 RepID=UPI0024C1E103|nr:nucleotidyltransferase family protein [Mesobacillus sp. AQ2]WHX41440.1 nucleotidyltransferase family protein [Mesobacillus sp. AQ2]
MINQLMAALYINEIELPCDEVYYEQLLTNQDIDSISTQLYHLLKIQGKLERVPDFFRQYLYEQYLQTIQLNLFVKHETTQILNAFEDRGMKVITLKGVCFAESYFGSLGARKTSDIDLLVKTDDVDATVKLVNQLGFTVEEEKIPGHFHCSYSKMLPGSKIPLVVELHWDLLKESTAQFNIEEFWLAAKPLGQYSSVKELSRPHVFYMIVLHGWRHNLDSLKYYLDIIQMIYFLKDDLDFDLLIKIAERHKTKKRIIRTLSSVYQEFPFLECIKPFPYKSSKKYLDFNSKKEGSNIYQKYSDFINYQYFSYDTPNHTIKEILATIIPAKK